MKLRIIHFEGSVVHPKVEGVSRSFAMGDRGVTAIEVVPALLAVRVTASGDDFYYPLARCIGMGPLPK